MAVAHPDIFKAIKILQNDGVTARINNHKAKLGEKIPPRSKKEIEKDGKIITLMTMLEDEDITLAVFIKKKYRFCSLRQKRHLSDTENVFFTDEDDNEEGEEILDSGPEESSETSITSESGTESESGSDNEDSYVDENALAPKINCTCKRACKQVRCPCKTSNTKCSSGCSCDQTKCANK